MDAITSILKRRSIRKFTNEKVSDEHIQILLECAMAAPSGMNMQPWEFYVANKEDEILSLKEYHPFLKMNAPLAIVVAGNLERNFKDYWVQDCSSAITNILTAVTALDLGATWCGVYPVEELVSKTQKLFSMPKNIVPLGIIMIGHPDMDKEARTQYNESYVHWKKD